MPVNTINTLGLGPALCRLVSTFVPVKRVEPVLHPVRQLLLEYGQHVRDGLAAWHSCCYSEMLFVSIAA